MRIYLDTADIEQLEEATSTGVVDGVTTNPTLIAKEGADHEERIKRICSLVDGPVLAEVVATERDAIVEEARRIASWNEKVVVKIPANREGIEAIHRLSGEDVTTAATLVFSPLQALAAARAGADFVIPFVGRLDDTGRDGIELVEEVVEMFYSYDIESIVLAASIRHVGHVLECSRTGVDAVTVPPKVLYQMMEHPMTAAGIEKFLRDWEAAGK